MASFTFWPVMHGHNDIIHDIAYDFYGRRIATCSSDQSVKVWDCTQSGEWRCTASWHNESTCRAARKRVGLYDFRRWKYHSGSVWRVDWAHPEFGQVLATCSFDRTVAIWQEMNAGGSHTSQLSGPNAAMLAQRPTHWVKKCQLVDSRSDVTDVKFGPHHLGLVLATCSANGVVRVYEAPDVMNLHAWHLQHEMDTGRPMHRHKLRCRALAWSTSRLHPQLLLVGCDEPKPPQGANSQIAVYEKANDARSWNLMDALCDFGEPVFDAQFAPSLGRSYHLLAVASRHVHLFALKPVVSQSDLTTGNTSAASLTGPGGQIQGAGQPTTQQQYDCVQLAKLDVHQVGRPGSGLWQRYSSLKNTLAKMSSTAPMK